MEQTLYIPYRLPNLNDIILASKSGRGKYNAYGRMKKEWETRIILLIREQDIKPVVRASFKFIWCEENKRRDLDNIAAGRKFILDALVEAGILPNDGWKNITGWEDVFRIREFTTVWVIIKSEEK